MSAAAAVFATAEASGIAIVGIAAIAAIGSAASSGANATAAHRETKSPLVTRSKNDGPRTNADTPAVLPPPQDLPVLGRQRPQDRLQRRAPAAALCFRARQDRAKPHHRGVGEEAAGACAGDQARALSWTAALRDPLSSC